MRTKINLGCAAAAILSAGLMFFASFALAANPPMGADRHVAKGVTCNSCHGEDLKNPKLPDDATCTQCHNKDALAEKTKDLPGANPHKAPHNGECINCHLQHEPPENYCAQCHKFDFNVK